MSVDARGRRRPGAGVPTARSTPDQSIRIDAIWFKARPWQLELSYRNDRAGADFLEDARIAWAVEDGDKPFGIAGPSAWPHSYQELAANVSAWVASGMPCPP